MKIIIVGGGQVGGYIADLLVKEHHSVTVIENRDKALQALRKNGLSEDCILTGDGTDAATLETATTASTSSMERAELVISPSMIWILSGFSAISRVVKKESVVVGSPIVSKPASSKSSRELFMLEESLGMMI